MSWARRQRSRSRPAAGGGSIGLVLWGPPEDKRYVDITVSSLYWYFVVAAWLPLYLLVYWLPRWG